jgi:hypothetical protein
MKWTRPLELFLEVIVALWMLDIFVSAHGQTKYRHGMYKESLKNMIA